MGLGLDTFDHAPGGQLAHRRSERGHAARLEREQAYRSPSQRCDQGRRRPQTIDLGLETLVPDHAERRRPGREPRLRATFSFPLVEPAGVPPHQSLHGRVARV
jgi:hypothetical protein